MSDVKRCFFLAGLTGLLLLAGTARAQMANMTFLHTPPARIAAGQDLRISGNIIGADQVSIAALAYRTEGAEEFEIRELRLLKGDAYEGVIPGKFVRTPAIEYYCYAVDFEGNRHVVFASEQEPQRVQVAAAIIGSRPGPTKPGPTKPDKPETTDKPGEADKKPGQAPEQVSFGARPPQESDLAAGRRQAVDRAPGLVAVVERRQIEAMGARTVADVLDQMAGISISRGVSGDFHLAMRGMQNDAEVLVLLDGHALNDLYSGAVLLEWPVEAVERIEVLRGPGAEAHGAGALLGVVHIHSRQGDGVWARAGYGMFDEVRLSAGGGASGESWRLGGQVQFMRSEGQDRIVYKDILSGVKGSIPSEPDVSNAPGSVDDSRMQLHAQMHASLSKLAGGKLEFMSHYLFQQRGAFVGKFDSLDLDSELVDHLAQANLSYSLPLGQMLELDSRAWVDLHMVDRDFQVIPGEKEGVRNVYLVGSEPLSDGMRERSSYQTLRTGLDIGAKVKLAAKNLLRAGLRFSYALLPDFTLERDIGRAASNLCAGTDDCEVPIQGFSLPVGRFQANPEGHQRIGIGAFAQDHWSDILPGLDALAGIRLDYFTDAGLAFAPRVAVVYEPLDGLDLKALYSMSYRVPTFQELYEESRFDPLRAYVGVESLTPVSNNTLEFGVAWRLRAAGVDYRVAGNFFISWIRDSIVGLDRGSGQPSYTNEQSIDLLGTEVEAEALFGERSRLFVNNSWFRAKVRLLGLADESYITDVPQMRLNLGLDLGMGKWVNLHLGLRHYSERRNNTRLSMELLRSFIIPATTVVRAGLSSEPLLFGGLVVYAHFTNVFDSEWSDPPPRPDHLTGLLPRTGFAFMLGLAWSPAAASNSATGKE